MTVQEAIYILFLQDGAPKTRYFSIENVEYGKTVLSSINTERFGTKNFKKSLLGSNCNSASVNMGAYGGLGFLIKENTAWLELVHCFNYWMELALKVVFENSALFKIENRAIEF